MAQKLPGFYIVRLIPRKPDGANLRGTFIPPTVDIRSYNISKSQSQYYDETVWARKLPPEFVIDSGQPPRITLEDELENGRTAYELKPNVGDILVLVHGSRSPSGDGDKARRGLIGLAEVQDVHFYEQKQLDRLVHPSRVSQKTWTQTRVSIRAKTIFITDGFLIEPVSLKQSIYYEKSGLKAQEAMLGISSTSASGNIGSLFSGNNNTENEERVRNLLALFKQFNPNLKEQLSNTIIQPYVPEEVADPTQMFSAVKNTNQVIEKFISNDLILQKIYFGAPGSGKSRKVKKDTEGMRVFRTTFHPDSDYAGFVGTYKPAMSGRRITYAFVPQLFTKAYVHAWQNPQQAVCLVIEEINRGNCAQIFGDLFQLLDRGADGFSEYELQVDTDLGAHLEEKLPNNQTYIDYTGGYEYMKLPPNLAIYATMNTSDQSLFPMDSAFKRRWDWEYVPIDYTDADTFTIVFSDDEHYSWGDFIRVVNKKIADVTESDDKQLGNRFVNPDDRQITKATFKSKVLFYLWSEVFKHEQKENPKNIFKYKLTENGETETIPFSFADLWEANEAAMLTSFMTLLNVPRKPVEA